MPGLSLLAAGASEGPSVLSAVLNLPRVGAWVALVEVATDRAMTGKVDLVIGSTRWKGKISRGAVQGGVFRARVVAGGDGLRKAVKPRHYRSPNVGLVLRDVAQDAGEAISSSSSSGVTGVQMDFWTTMALPAGQVIRCLMDFAPADTVWRHLPDGSIWLGSDSFADSGITDFAEIGESPEDGVVDFQLVDPLVYPGTKLGGRQVDSAQITVTGGEVRAKIWTP